MPKLTELAAPAADHAEHQARLVGRVRVERVST
jgi:hypothetical protein